MLEIIAEAFPRTIEALRRAHGMRRPDAAALILSARYGERACAWSAMDCGKARAMIAGAFINRGARLRLQGEG